MPFVTKKLRNIPSDNARPPDNKNVRKWCVSTVSIGVVNRFEISHPMVKVESGI